jgi:hypothetical protein
MTYSTSTEYRTVQYIRFFQIRISKNHIGSEFVPQRFDILNHMFKMESLSNRHKQHAGTSPAQKI